MRSDCSSSVKREKRPLYGKDAIGMKVERAFRCMKLSDLEIRPVYHWRSDCVRAHVFLCMLSYYVEWHLRKALAPARKDATFTMLAKPTKLQAKAFDLLGLGAKELSVGRGT